MVLTQYNFFHLKWFGDGSEAAKQWVNEIIVRAQLDTLKSNSR